MFDSFFIAKNNRLHILSMILLRLNKMLVAQLYSSTLAHSFKWKLHGSYFDVLKQFLSLTLRIQATKYHSVYHN